MNTQLLQLLQLSVTFACLSSSSASSTRFFLNADTRLVLKSISSEDRRQRQTQQYRTGSGSPHPAEPLGFWLTLLGRLRDLLELVAAELLAGLGLQDVPVLGSSFVQSLVGVFIVHQSPASAVQEVLQRSHDQETLGEFFLTHQ